MTRKSNGFHPPLKNGSHHSSGSPVDDSMKRWCKVAVLAALTFALFLRPLFLMLQVLVSGPLTENPSELISKLDVPQHNGSTAPVSRVTRRRKRLFRAQVGFQGAISRTLQMVLDQSSFVTCHNPEYVPWVFEGCEKSDGESSTYIGRSRTSGLTCGLCKQNKLTQYLGKVSFYAQRLAKKNCPVIVNSALFDKRNEKQYSRYRLAGREHRKRVNCIFLFILERDAKRRKDLVPTDPPSDGYILESRFDATALRVVIPEDLLPFYNMRRNVKLIKLHGHQIFSWAERLIWMDAKFRRQTRMGAFMKYFDGTVGQNRACVSFMGMPVLDSNMGEDYFKYRQPNFPKHCETVVSAARYRPNVTDSTDAIQSQCHYYLSQTATGMSNNSHPISPLDDRLVDSALIAWDLTSRRCRQFNADLSCTWADEIQCHADRDQISFPYALNSMNLIHKDGQIGGPETDTLLVSARNVPYVEILRSDCHWIHGPPFDCFIEEIEEVDEEQGTSDAQDAKSEPG